MKRDIKIRVVPNGYRCLYLSIASGRTASLAAVGSSGYRRTELQRCLGGWSSAVGRGHGSDDCSEQLGWYDSVTRGWRSADAASVTPGWPSCTVSTCSVASARYDWWCSDLRYHPIDGSVDSGRRTRFVCRGGTDDGPCLDSDGTNAARSSSAHFGRGFERFSDCTDVGGSFTGTIDGAVGSQHANGSADQPA